MKQGGDIPLVTTLREHCRMCYTCVRECPAKAIRIADGQADVVADRCIGCGNCVQCCSQHAKQMLDTSLDVTALLASGAKVAAMVAPSFPAEFAECDPGHVVGMLRALGFTYVHEVAFGADLVADRYRELLARNDGKRYIATTCPALVAYVERYHPDLVASLAPIASPMVAMARVVRWIHGDGVKVVFIGPCLAKKGEAASRILESDVDIGLTFIELRALLEARGITPAMAVPSDFDPPHGGVGGLFAISRGLLQAAHIQEDLVDSRVVAAEGRTHFVEAIKEFESGHLEAKLLEVLCCEGCINGPGLSRSDSLFARRNRVSKYVRKQIGGFDWHLWRKDISDYALLDLTRKFAADDQRFAAPSEEEIREILALLGKLKPQDELNCGACGYDTCREHALAIHKGLAEPEMCLPYMIDQLRTTMRDLATSNDELAETRQALFHSERLASMGQLAAGIAHEINNPLGVVLMYAHLLKEEKEGDDPLLDDLNMIVEQADRCKKIVAGLLHFARQNKVDRQDADVRELLARALRACPAPEGVEIIPDHQIPAGMAISLDVDQMLQVLTNLINNAFASMSGGGVLTIRTTDTPTQLKIRVSDTGCGIPKQNLDKIFEPFFTTKEVGKGTGLGLSVTYGIVKMHRGDISVESNCDPASGPTGTAFTVSLPR